MSTKKASATARTGATTPKAKAKAKAKPKAQQKQTVVSISGERLAKIEALRTKMMAKAGGVEVKRCSLVRRIIEEGTKAVEKSL